MFGEKVKKLSIWTYLHEKIDVFLIAKVSINLDYVGVIAERLDLELIN